MSLSAADSGAHAFGDLPIEGAKVAKHSVSVFVGEHGHIFSSA